MGEAKNTDTGGRCDLTELSTGSIKSLSHKELSGDERFRAAAQISATLFQNPSSKAEASSWIPCVVRDGYVRSLVEVLQHILCSADCAESARTDRRLWRLLARVLESESLDGDSLNKKLTMAARLGILHWSSEGDAEAVDGFAEDLLAVFETIHARFTLSHFDRAEKWVELLEACISSTLAFPRGSHSKHLIGFLASQCILLQREEKPWFTPILAKLLFPALECIHASGNELESVENSLKTFLGSALFNPVYLEDFKKFAAGQMGGENPQWRSIGGRKTDKSNAGLFFKKLQTEIHGVGKTKVAVLQGLPWMLDHLCKQLRAKEMPSAEQDLPNLGFSFFATFVAIALPSSSSNDTVGKKRKASEPDSWVHNISAMEGLLSVVIETGAYRPTDTSAPLQMSVLQTLLDTVMAGVGPCLTSKRRKTGEGPVWDGLTAAVSGVVKKLLKMEHRVVHPHLEQILDLAFMESQQCDSGSDEEMAGGGDMLGLLITAYSEVRQLDILLASVLNRLNEGEWGSGKTTVAISGEALRILSECVWNAPPMQNSDLLKCALGDFSRCKKDMGGNAVRCMSEIVVCILQSMKVTLSEAAPIAAAIKASMHGEVACSSAAETLTEFPLKNDGIKGSWLVLAMLQVCGSCSRLYQSCALMDPAITPPLLEEYTNMDALNGRLLFRIVEEVKKQHVGQHASLTRGNAMAWQRTALECLMQKLHALSSVHMKEKYLPSDISPPSNAMSNGTISPARESPEGLTNAILDCIPLESYDQIYGGIVASPPSQASRESEMLASSWVDLCDSFLLWSPHASKEQLMCVLKKVILIGSHSSGKSDSERNAMENATWRLLSDPDTFVSECIVEGLVQAVGEVVYSLLGGGLSGFSQTKATPDPGNPKEFFKMLSNKSSISQWMEGLNSQGGLGGGAYSVVGNGRKGSQENGLNRLAEVFQLASRFPCESMGKGLKLGLSIGLGTAVFLLRENWSPMESTFTKCCAGVLRWIALVCVETSLKKPQLNFLIALTGAVMQMGVTGGNDQHFSDMLKSLGSLGLANCDQLEMEDLDTLGNECVRFGVQVGVVRGHLQRLRRPGDEVFRKSVKKSMKPVEKRCVAEFERFLLLRNDGEGQPKTLVSWCFGSLCHSVAGLLRLHRVNSKRSSLPSSKLPPSIAKVYDLLATILDSLSQERLSKMPTYSLVGLVDLLSVIGSCLGSFDPLPGVDAWVGLVRFHARILMSLPKPLPLDPTLQSSSLTDSNPTILVDGENSEVSELRQAIIQSVVSLAHAVSRCEWTMYDSMIRKVLQALGDGKNCPDLYAWSQILNAGLTAGQPRSKLRRKCVGVVMDVVSCISTSSRYESMDRGLRSSSVCCLLRAIVVLSRSVDRHDARSFILSSCRIGALLFGWREVRADVACGPGIFIECCSILNCLASKQTAQFIHVCIAGLLSSFRALLRTLVDWLDSGISQPVLVQCADSVGTAAARLAKVRGKLDSFGLDLVMEFVEAIAKIKRLESVQGVGVVARLTETAMEVYSATNRLKRKHLFAMVDSEESRFVMDGLKIEDSKRKKIRV
ncbi:hypothetical protein BSKO_02200 [Bryopsis sp. KO-2023]|nr:hypothetical protein BSKO_02200 [Bryopsis sp. KO-2023]